MNKKFQKQPMPWPLAGSVGSKLKADLRYALTLHQRGQLAGAEQIYRGILKSNPDHFDAIHLLGVTLMQCGRAVEGEQLLAKALRVNPNHLSTLNNRGLALHELRRFHEAVASYDKAIALKPDKPEAFYNRGNALKALKRFDEALASYDTATALKPDFAEAFNNQGLILQELKRFDEALASYDKALALKPNYAEALNNQGNAFQELERLDEALASYDKAIALKPEYVEAFYNRGNALKALKCYDKALASYDIATALNPNFVEVFNNRGLALHELKRFDDALASYHKALALKPTFAEAMNNRGNAFRELERLDEALASYDTAIALKPRYTEAFYNRGNALKALNRSNEALVSYDTAIALKPDYAEAFNNRGVTLQELKRFDEALASYEQALVIQPNAYAFSGIADCALRICDWSRVSKLTAELKLHVIERKSIVLPFTLLGYSSDAALQLKCAQGYISDKISITPQPLWKRRIWRNDKIRIAYLSADFRQHPVADLVAELFAVHDRSRFDVLGVSFGPDDKSEMRSRLIKSFDIFHDARFESDEDVAKLLHRLQVDIAVDLMGHTRESRPGILSHRPAPIQVSYLGFPATTGAEFIDYVIADKVVLPFDQQPYYTEKIVHLPECYQVNDSQRKITDRSPTRVAAGLPERGFVYCCFNNSYKITAVLFDVWMRLLKAIDGSVLWLRHDNDIAEKNLRREAERHGIDPARLVFASRLPLSEDHLARYRLADLFLDTLPYNAHATASDALWAGLPVLTCCGASFAGRVAASLLNAIGLPILVTYSLEEYEALALQLAQNAPLLTSIRAELARNREVCPLFNTNRFTRHLEAAYLTMWNIWQRGERARSFSVAPAPD